jgi:PAS domain S-box-containing protein
MNFLSGGGEMGERIRSHNWSETSLGPIESWPQSLRTSLSLILTSYYPLFFWWGEDHIQFYNDAYIPILGEKHPKSLGQIGEECWPEAWHLVKPMIDAVKRGESTFNKNTMLPLQRNGYAEECYFDFAYSPVRNESGDVAGIFAAVSETTEQVINERRLGVLAELGVHMLEAQSVKEACQIPLQALSKSPVDIPYALIYLKEGNGYRLVASYGLDAYANARPDNVAIKVSSPSTWNLEEVTESGKPYLEENLTVKFGDLPGGPWPAPSHAALLLPIQLPAQNQPFGVFVAGISPGKAFDNAYSKFLKLVSSHIESAISNGKTYEEERLRMEKLVELDQAKTNFFSNVSHEFRTPLTLMLGPLQDTISGANKSLPEADRKQLTTVYQNAQRLLKLVNTLLDFSRIEAKRAQASYEPTDLSFYTSELASAFEPTIEKAGLKYEIICSPLSEPVYVDPEMWEKIVLNLVSNAFKFTFEGKITVELEETATHAKLTVQDTGVGIPQEELPNLFKRFHRVQNSRSRSHEGTGIGLALVKELVELHGGTVDVASTAGKGTTFTVRIPKGTSHLEEQKIAAEMHAGSTAERAELYVNEAALWGKHDAEAEMLLKENTTVAQGHVQPDKKTRILLVDDNADLLMYLKRILSTYWQVEAVRDGIEALAAARREIPDLILSDVMMPHMNGFELLSEIRKDESLGNIPVILLSARAGEEATIEGLGKGANDYLVKPFSALELLARIRAQLDITRTRKDNILLRKAEEELKKFKIISDYAFDAFILMREDGTFAYLNDLALERWGYTREEALSIRVPDVDPIYQEEKFNEVFALAQKQSIPPFETLHMRKDGTTYPVEVSMGGLTLEGKSHMFAVARDITARKLAEETLKSRNEELERTNNDLDNFIYTASHDLKAPILNIEGLMETLLDQLPPKSLQLPAVERTVGFISASVQRFKRTIEHLTEISKLQKENSPEASPVSLSAVIAEVQLDLAPAIRAAQAKLEIDVATYPAVRFPEKNLRSVIYNLLSNAVKYRSPERAPLVRVHCHETAEYQVLSVEDNGLGMDLSQEHKLFAMFKRLHDHVEGSGVGLYMVKKIVENAGGKIDVQSKVGEGSTFQVYFRKGS